ncbi:transposase [Nostoc punctiforme UO1]|uniref:IS66 family transposase n=1 Tax=Nostoc punctiforme TaxID=272131 RepID=UPI00309EBE71
MRSLVKYGECRATQYRHQIVEIPPISPIVIEHRLHQLTCTGGCGSKTRAKLPEDVNQSDYGVRVVALVALLSGVYRNSQRMVQSAMQEVFGISISLGTVNRLRLEASNAVATCVDEAKLYIQKANIVGADETSFNQGNIHGFNPEQRKAWLWVAVTPLVTFFEIALSRCTQGAKNLLGENFGGILNSDRHGAYNWVDLERRQLCWAHLRREFIKISERTGVSAELGTALVKQLELLFELWHRVRDGTLSRGEFVELVQEIRSLRHLQRDYPASLYIFHSSRLGPLAHDTIAGIVERAGKLAGLLFPIHAHMLRHGTGYYLANRGIDTRTIQNYLGHKNIQHTVRYTELASTKFQGLWDD